MRLPRGSGAAAALTCCVDTAELIRELFQSMAPCKDQFKFMSDCVRCGLNHCVVCYSVGNPSCSFMYSWTKATGHPDGLPEFRYLAGVSAWAIGEYAAAAPNLALSGHPDKYGLLAVTCIGGVCWQM